MFTVTTPKTAEPEISELERAAHAALADLLSGGSLPIQLNGDEPEQVRKAFTAAASRLTPTVTVEPTGENQMVVRWSFKGFAAPARERVERAGKQCEFTAKDGTQCTVTQQKRYKAKQGSKVLMVCSTHAKQLGVDPGAALRKARKAKAA